MKLKNFVTRKTGVEKIYYTLAKILTILKEVIRGEQLFDPDNQLVILCSTDLEEALDIKALHVTEIRNLILAHITKVPDQHLRKDYRDSSPTKRKMKKQSTNPKITGGHSIHI